MRKTVGLILASLVAGSAFLPPAILAQPRETNRGTSQTSNSNKEEAARRGERNTTRDEPPPSSGRRNTAGQSADAKSEESLPALFGPVEQSASASRLTKWVLDSRDNGTLPFIVIDKKAATVFVYDSKGKPLGDTPALLGITNGDDSTPGVGDKPLAELGPAEKTTPAGRFVARIGPANAGQKVLWIDYETSVALHAVVTGNKNERRRERLLSPTISDNRITFGCINVPANFYSQQVEPVFEKTGGIVYVLPDVKPLETVFPRLRNSRIAMQRVSF